MRTTKKEIKPSVREKLVEITNFKSIKHIKFKTSRINIFIGRPNSGKSNLIESLTLFNLIQPKSNRVYEPTFVRYTSLDDIFYDRDIFQDIEIKYGQNFAVMTYYRAINSYIQLINPSKEFIAKKASIFKRNLSVNQIGEEISFLPKAQLNNFESKYGVLNSEGNVTGGGGSNGANVDNPIRRYEFHELPLYNDLFTSYLKPSGANLFSIVQGNSKLRDWIYAFFESTNLEFLLDIKSKSFEVQKKENGIVYKIPFELTPDTFRRMLYQVAAIYSNNNSTIIFEEPEVHSFPPYIKEFSDLVKMDKSNSYFITTHSPYFLNSMIEDSIKYKDISFFYVFYEGFQTKIRKLTEKDLNSFWGKADIFNNIDSLLK